MVKDLWDSFKDNIKQRVTNPFLGTYIIVWLAHNWEVVYSFFYFDKDWNLEKKLNYFKDYWEDKSFFWNLMCVAAITVGILIITYFFLAISRYIANSFENRVVPFIQKISKGKIVTSEVYQIALDKIFNLESKVEAERKAKNEAIAERDEFEKRFYANKSNEMTSVGPNEYEEYIIAYENLKKEEKLFIEFQKIAPKAQRELKMFPEGHSINMKLFDYFLANDIVEKVSPGVYMLTEKGKFFNRRLLDEKLITSKV